MAGPYQRIQDGQSADVGESAITTVVNAVEEGLEAVEAALPGKAAASHTHAQGDITGLASALASKADTSHGHAQSDITGLTTALAGKSDTGHTHPEVYDPAGSAAAAQAAAAVDATTKANAAQAASVQRANHTGTQLASTIGDFDTRVRTSRLDQMAAPTAAVALGGQRITGLATPVAATDAATKAYVDGGSAADRINLAAEGVVQDCRSIKVSTVAGNTRVVAQSSDHPALGANVFSASDVGKAIHINGAAAGAWLRTTVSAFVSPTQVDVAVAPTSSVTDRGAVIGTDNTTTLSSIFAGLTEGAFVYAPASSFGILTSGGHTTSANRIVFAGAGREATRFVTTADTANMFTFNGYLCEVRDMQFLHGAGWANLANSGTAVWPTAGSAIRFTATFWAGARIRNVHAVGFYIGGDVNSGQVQIDDSVWESCYLAGLRLDNSAADYGMHSVRGCHFAWSAGARQSGASGVLWIKGGGLGITECRFDGRTEWHVRMQFDGSEYTGNIRINNNMFEDFQAHAIYATVSTGDGDLGYISISNNVIQGGGNSPINLNAATYGANRFRVGSDHGFAAVSIIGNARYNGVGSMVTLTRCRDVAVVGNTQIGGTVVAQTNCVNVRES